jgi:hypothetical protein
MRHLKDGNWWKREKKKSNWGNAGVYHGIYFFIFLLQRL